MYAKYVTTGGYKVNKSLTFIKKLLINTIIIEVLF